VQSKLIGTRRIGDDSGRRLAELQYQLADAAGLPIVQWRDPTLALDEKKIKAAQRLLLEGSHVMASEPEKFKAFLVRRIEDILAAREQAAKRAATAPTTKPLVFVNSGIEDVELAEQLRSHLNTDFGCDAEIPIHEGHPGQIRDVLEMNLLECQGLIMLYGRVKPPWVRTQLRLASRILSSQGKPLPARAICRTPPGDQSPLDFNDIEQVDCISGWNDQWLSGFISRLAKEAVT
jgi:hypothetical protein